MSQHKIHQQSTPVALMLSLINWLIPGAGYIMVKDTARGVTLFVVINAVFAMGLLYGGYILAPATLSYRSADFNLVGLLTWFVQAGHGLGWIGLQGLHKVTAGNDQAFFSLERLARQSYSDVGALHLLVAGGLNYFASAHLYDLLTGQAEAPRPHLPPHLDHTSDSQLVEKSGEKT